MPLPGFGTVGFDSLSLARTTDLIEFRDGLDIDLVYRTETGTVSQTKTDITHLAWGLAPQVTQGPTLQNPLGRTLESVTLTESENVATHEAYIDGNLPPLDKLVFIDGFLILSKEVTMTVTGFGDLPVGYEENLHGTPGYDLEIATAIPGDGSVSVAIEDAILINPRQDRSITDWHKFTFELRKVVPQDDGVGAAHLVTGVDIPAQVLAGNYTISRTTTFSAEAWATAEVTIEEHYGTARADIWPPTV